MNASAFYLLRKRPIFAFQAENNPVAAGSSSCEMISRWPKGLALEMPRSAESCWITPTKCFYVFNHTDFPFLTTQDWQLKITGEVEHPLTLNWSALQELKQLEVINTLECAGNGRAFFKPSVDGVQWATGAVGNAKFTGPRLADVLKLAKPGKAARHIGFMGQDTPSQFIRSIPIEKALDPDTILATTMNGKPLTPEHGFPVRAIVPGWVGAASVKRVIEIQFLPHEAQGEMMQSFYRIPDPRDSSKSEAVTVLQVKSIITHPLKGAILRLAPVAIQGAAWAGESAVAKVQLSTDSGETWQPARLAASRGKYAWRLWRYLWTPPHAGEFSITVRATDTSGNTQPQISTWNPRGYLWNAWDSIQVIVKA